MRTKNIGPLTLFHDGDWSGKATIGYAKPGGAVDTFEVPGWVLLALARDIVQEQLLYAAEAAGAADGDVDPRESELRRLRYEAEMACQEPYDECECPGCMTANDRGGA